MTDDRAHAALQRISDALGMSPDDFLDQAKSGSTEAKMLAAREVAELLEAFEQITDPTARQACLAFVKARHPKERSQRV